METVSTRHDSPAAGGMFEAGTAGPNIPLAAGECSLACVCVVCVVPPCICNWILPRRAVMLGGNGGQCLIRSLRRCGVTTTTRAYRIGRCRTEWAHSTRSSLTLCHPLCAYTRCTCTILSASCEMRPGTRNESWTKCTARVDYCLTDTCILLPQDL